MYEQLFELERTGIQINYYTNQSECNPMHWHSAIELIYFLNGSGTIMAESKDYPAVAREFVIHRKGLWSWRKNMDLQIINCLIECFMKYTDVPPARSEKIQKSLDETFQKPDDKG